MRRARTAVLLVLVVAALVSSRPVSAQLAVIDAANLVETAQTAYNTYQAYRTLLREYEVILRMARRHAGMDRYRTPNVPLVQHEPGRYLLGAPFLTALNSGDPTGALYFRVVRRAERPESLPASVPAAARSALERAYATIDIADSTTSMAGHQVGHVRSFSGSVTGAVQALEADTLGGSDNEHQQTAILDRMAATQIVARRQDEATNQLVSHLLEQSLVQNKRQRDAEAVAMSMRVNHLRYYRDYSRSFYPPSADAAARAWRQP